MLIARADAQQNRDRREPDPRCLREPDERDEGQHRVRAEVEQLVTRDPALVGADGLEPPAEQEGGQGSQGDVAGEVEQAQAQAGEDIPMPAEAGIPGR